MYNLQKTLKSSQGTIFVSLRNIVSLLSNDMDPSLDNIFRLENQGKYEEALAACDKALDTNPGDFALYLVKSFCYKDLERYPQAIKCIDKSLRYADGIIAPVLALHKANLLHKCGIYDKAVEWIDIATQNGMADPTTYAIKGSSLHHLYIQSNDKKLVESILYCYDKALEDPANAGLYADKGKIMIDLGEYGQALECYDQGLLIKPDDARLLAEKAFALTFLDRFKEAYDLCLKVTNLEAYDLPTLYTLAAALHALGQTKPATEAINIVLELDPSFHRAKELEQLIKKAEKSEQE